MLKLVVSVSYIHYLLRAGLGLKFLRLKASLSLINAYNLRRLD